MGNCLGYRHNRVVGSIRSPPAIVGPLSTQSNFTFIQYAIQHLALLCFFTTPSNRIAVLMLSVAAFKVYPAARVFAECAQQTALLI